MSDINAILDRHGIKRCGDSSCIFGPRGGMMTNGGCRCGRQLAHAVTEQAAEIARLTADLAAARAVPADVEAALCDSSCWICDREDPIRGANLDRVKAAIARAISDATAARGTVGGLLATAPVGSIVEFWHGATANQITTRVGGIDDRVWLWRYRNPNGEWSPWDYEAPSPDDLSQPGEIVPADPNQRGPLPKGG